MNKLNTSISFPSGPLDDAAPRRGANRRGSGGKRKEPREFVHGPVKVPQELLDLLIKHGKRNRTSNLIRIAVTNCMHQSPGGSDYPVSEIWDVLGRWASNLRGMKHIEGITERHEAWEHVQRLRFALDRAEHDPLLQKKRRYRINLFLHEALLAWDKAMAAHFAEHPEDLMTPDEFAGLEAPPTAQSVNRIEIFKRPPKPMPHPVKEVPSEQTDESQPVAKVASRPAQKASLFGPKLANPDSDELE